jgi:hypothetical protein
MKQENANFDVKELTEKIEKIDELCKKDFFSNPVRDIQLKMREELLEFSNIFYQNLRDLDSAYVVFFLFRLKFKIVLRRAPRNKKKKRKQFLKKI